MNEFHTNSIDCLSTRQVDIDHQILEEATNACAKCLSRSVAHSSSSQTALASSSPKGPACATLEEEAKEAAVTGKKGARGQKGRSSAKEGNRLCGSMRADSPPPAWQEEEEEEEEEEEGEEQFSVMRPSLPLPSTSLSGTEGSRGVRGSRSGSRFG